jgi:outer membrane protein assembly factor BamB
VIDTGSAVLFALDARTGEAIYRSHGKDALQSTHRFITPAVADGRVYVGAGQALSAYGLLKH